ncbi:MAG TPA: maleylpyruvate isomerase N-terminal domain-containing protein [Frankiaceae bacterium]|nr:maleylpyruvate isomerase N-terminal domain-containing protein [Frankiaceae bacterium]
MAESLFAAYARTRERVVALIAATPEDELNRVVPACPAWTVHDLLAHVVSIPAALSTGRRPTGDIGEWLLELVDERSTQPAKELSQEWQGLDKELDAMLSGPSALLFGDLAVHEHDFRGALGRPDHAALEIEAMLPRTIAAFSTPLREAGLAPIEVRAGDQVWRSHDGEPGWTLIVDPWTAVRALNSRRTAGELYALASEGDASDYLPILDAHLPLPAESLGEV